MNRFQKSFWVPMALPRLLWHHTYPSADLTSPPAFVLYTSKRDISFEQSAQYKTLCNSISSGKGL